MSGDVTGHKYTWDGPFGATYLIKCECGWMGNTFAATRETSIHSTWERHLNEPPPLTLHQDQPDLVNALLESLWRAKADRKNEPHTQHGGGSE